MSTIKGKKFCVTGTLSSMKRMEAEAQIIKAGGSVVKKPSKNVDIVVCGENAGSKLALAESLELNIWTEDDLVDNLAGKAKKGKAKGKKTKAPAKKKKAQHPADEKPAKKQKKLKEEEEEEEEEACNKVQANPTFSQDGMFEVLVEGNDVYDANLSQINIKTNTDKYYQLQLLLQDEEALVCAHWGRTGSKGQHKKLCEGNLETCKKEFCKHFKSKTGAAFADRLTYTAKANKYTFKKMAYKMLNFLGKWQYQVTDGVDGKKPGWYDYPSEAATMTEKLHDDWEANHNMPVRCVESGHFTYRVDFNAMTQTNISTGTRRNIRREV